MIVSRGRCETSSQHAAVRRAAPFLDLGVARQGDPVPGRQLHPLRVVARHEPLAEAVAQDAALPAGRLGDEGAGRVLGLDQAGRVELHQLGVADPAAGLDREAERVAGVLVATRRGAAPDPGVAAGREDHRVGVDDVAGAVLQVEAVRAEDDVVADQEPGDVDGVEDRDLRAAPRG